MEINIMVFRVNETYGGKSYVEYDSKLNAYKTGTTRSHAEHFQTDSKRIEIEVKTLKELINYERQLIAAGVKNVTSEY